jgi:hypothetical protein
MIHYSKDSTTCGVAHDAVPLFQDEDDNPLINELGIYILDKLCMFQKFRTCKRHTSKDVCPAQSNIEYIIVYDIVYDIINIEHISN